MTISFIIPFQLHLSNCIKLMYEFIENTNIPSSNSFKILTNKNNLLKLIKLLAFICIKFWYIIKMKNLSFLFKYQIFAKYDKPISLSFILKFFYPTDKEIPKEFWTLRN